jgi:hypothetical protein
MAVMVGTGRGAEAGILIKNPGSKPQGASSRPRAGGGSYPSPPCPPFFKKSSDESLFICPLRLPLATAHPTKLEAQKPEAFPFAQVHDPALLFVQFYVEFGQLLA